MTNIASTGLSSCHKAEMRVVGDETMHYECTICGEACDIWSSIPPVNESWVDELKDMYVIDMLTSFMSYEDDDDLKRIKETDMFKNTVEAYMKSIVPFIKSLLSTARQEERERFSGWIAEVFAEANDIVQMQKLLRKKLNMVDSLTSKGGTNG